MSDVMSAVMSASMSAVMSAVRVLRFPQLVLREVRHPLRHPLRRRRSLEIMVEELEVPDREILPVRQAAQSMAFAGIREQDGVLPVVPQRVVEVEPFAEAHR